MFAVFISLLPSFACLAFLCLSCLPLPVFPVSLFVFVKESLNEFHFCSSLSSSCSFQRKLPPFFQEKLMQSHRTSRLYPFARKGIQFILSLRFILLITFLLFLFLLHLFCLKCSLQFLRDVLHFLDSQSLLENCGWTRKRDKKNISNEKTSLPKNEMKLRNNALCTSGDDSLCVWNYGITRSPHVAFFLFLTQNEEEVFLLRTFQENKNDMEFVKETEGTTKDKLKKHPEWLHRQTLSSCHMLFTAKSLRLYFTVAVLLKKRFEVTQMMNCPLNSKRVVLKSNSLKSNLFQ